MAYWLIIMVRHSGVYQPFSEGLGMEVGVKMLPFSTSGKGSILLYPFRSSPLLAITFLYHPKDFFLYRAAALFEYREKQQ